MKQTIEIKRSRIYTPDEGTFDGDTKNRQHRYTRLPPETVQLLRRWRQEQDDLTKIFGCPEDGCDYVFTWEGNPIHPDSITHHISALAEKTGLDGMHTHTLRHTAASVLIGSGVDLVTVAGHLGHRDASTTSRVYAHAIERNKAAAAEALGGVIYANKNNEPE